MRILTVSDDKPHHSKIPWLQAHHTHLSQMWTKTCGSQLTGGRACRVLLLRETWPSSADPLLLWQTPAAWHVRTRPTVSRLCIIHRGCIRPYTAGWSRAGREVSRQTKRSPENSSAWIIHEGNYTKWGIINKLNLQLSPNALTAHIMFCICTSSFPSKFTNNQKNKIGKEKLQQRSMWGQVNNPSSMFWPK